MQVVIETISGKTSGAKHVLQDGQQLTFGRTSWADVSFAADGKMSGTHFSVSNDGRCCLLRDAGSTNGTELNSEFVKQAALSNGDRVKAGQTQFLVSITGQPASAEDESGGSLPGDTASASVIIRDLTRSVLSVGSSSLTYFVEPCVSSLVAFRHYPEVEEVEDASEDALGVPAIVFELLAQELNATLIVDYRKFGEAPPEVESEARTLFHWLPPETAKTLSPWALPVSEAEEYSELIDKAWDSDALIAFFSEKSSEETIEHLASQLRSPDGGAQASMLGWCWPSVLSQLLAFRDQDFVEGLLGDCQAVLVEIPDLPGGWQLFASPLLKKDLLEKIGFSDLADHESGSESGQEVSDAKTE